MKIGRKIIRLDSVDSTNNYAANLLKQGEIESGTVILADEQYAGRGQRDAEWLVKPGENLTFSFFLANVNLSVNNQFYLTQLVSLSLIDLLLKFGVSATIKWPNDIYVGQKKIAGVLIENQLAFNQVKSSIFGIGLNVNQQEFDGFKATSMFLESGVSKIPNDVLFSFIESFNKIGGTFSSNQVESIREEYLRNLYLRKIRALFEDELGKFEGEIVNVLDSGELVIDREGELKSYNLKEIKFI